ncbi:hypothetical protein BCR35DRAFT_354306 [Leucosporidium creatinivorum]|uniref:Uncharacterized protein n=1 Tax=Leucosporidium creatinivorum TaxID=106004 RepID=A0A1Y2EN56_9BASI|nr:hypothetical protein BCR35DRAFT_354306 [Leucosporidium creatinivorum]
MHPMLPYLASSYSRWSHKPSNQVAATAITQKSTSTTSTPSGAILSPSRPILASPCAWTFATGLVASPSFKLVRLQAKLALFAGPYKRVPKEEEERVEGAWEWEENLFIAEEEEDFGDLSDSDSFSSDDSLRSSPPSLLFDSPPQSLFPDLSSPPVPTEKLPAPSHADEQSVDEDFDDNVEEENSYSTSDGSVTEEIYDSNLDRFTYTELYPGEQDDEEYFAELPTFADSPSPSPRPPADFTVLKAEKLEFSCVDELQLESSCSPIFAPSPIRVNLPPPSPRLTPASLSIPQHITNLSNIDDDSFLPTFIHLPSIRKITTLPPRPRRKFSAPSPSLHREVVLYASLKAAVWLNDWQKANSFEELREWSALSLSDATSWTELGEGRGRASERKGRG